MNKQVDNKETQTPSTPRLVGAATRRMFRRHPSAIMGPASLWVL